MHTVLQVTKGLLHFCGWMEQKHLVPATYDSSSEMNKMRLWGYAYSSTGHNFSALRDILIINNNLVQCSRKSEE
jgi:hypothetical protein